jgi:hypothetical protein
MNTFQNILRIWYIEIDINIPFVIGLESVSSSMRRQVTFITDKVTLELGA